MPRSFVDINNNLYCSVKHSHKVVKKSLNNNGTLIVAAGNGSRGSKSNMLSSPSGIFVNVNLDLYVADCGNNRAQRYQSGQSNGTTVETGNITLICPTGIVLDVDGHLFIVDSGKNRIVGSGSNGFRCLLGCDDVSGSMADQLHQSVTMSFDSYGNMFVTDVLNDRVQKFVLSTNSCDQTTASPEMSASTTSIKDSTQLIQSTTLTTQVPIADIITSSPQVIQSTMLTTHVSKVDVTTDTPQFMQSTTLTTEVSKVDITTSSQQKDNPPSLPYTSKPCNNSARIGHACGISSAPCDMLKPCENGACYNNGTTINGYFCSCPSDFNGTECQFDHRRCKPNTCWNNGTCNATLNATSSCLCEVGWEGEHCETKIDYCFNVTCENHGVCRSLFLNYLCECLGESYSGRHCEITSTKIIIYKIVSKSFAYIAIIAMTSVAMFIVIMDILKYCFGIDPTREDLERIRREKQARKRKPVIQRFIYVNAPPPPSEESISETVETAV